MIKLLIADKSKLFAKAVAAEFVDKYEIKLCHDGNAVLDSCRLWQPDYMLLDMELPAVDGLTILRTLHGAKHHVKVMARTACCNSNYVTQTLTQLGVQFLLPNPCTVAVTVTQLHNMIETDDMSGWDREDEIIGLLLHLGFRCNLNGFACLCEALRLMTYDGVAPVTKVIYPQVAHVCGGTAERVERAIRNAIVRTWSERDDRIWQYYFSPGRDGQIACPSNAEFMSRMILCLDIEKIG